VFLKYLNIEANENGPTGREKKEFLDLSGMVVKKTETGSQKMCMSLNTKESRKRRNQ